MTILTDKEIKEVFLANGFTVKEGQTDLKPYVYAAAKALLRAEADKQMKCIFEARPKLGT